MITEKGYNDFSEMINKKKSDKSLGDDFFIEEIVKFVNDGGNLSLPVLLEKYWRDDELKLISFSKFVSSCTDNPSAVLEKLVGENDDFGLISLSYQDGVIMEKPRFGLDWIKNKIVSGERRLPVSMIKNLLGLLPEDFNEIKKWDEIRNYGELSVSSIHSPLEQLLTRLMDVEVFELIKEKYPTFLKERKDYFDWFIEKHGSFTRNDEASLIFLYQNGFSEKITGRLLDELVYWGVYNERFDFLQDVFRDHGIEKFELKNDFLLSIAKSVDMADFLLKNGAKTKDGDNFAMYLLKTEVDDVGGMLQKILEHDPVSLNEIKTNQKGVYTSFFNYKHFNFNLLKFLVSHCEFKLGDFEFINKIYHSNEQITWFVENGGDINKCRDFCQNTVLDREVGLKKLKQLIKDGYIEYNNPNYIKNIFQGSTTKKYLDFYNKLKKEDFMQYVSDGTVLWWNLMGTQFEPIATKNIDLSQKSKSGTSIHMFFSKMNRVKKSGFSSYDLKGLFKKKGEDFLVDIFEKDEKGRNIFHYDFLIKSYIKDIISVDNWNECKKVYSAKDMVGVLFEKDNLGISPVEILLSLDVKKSSYFLANIFSDFGNDFDYRFVLSDGVSFYEKLSGLNIIEKEKLNKAFLDFSLNDKGTPFKKSKI